MKSDLSDEELILLDNFRDQLSNETRALVDSAKARLLYTDELVALGFEGKFREKAGAFILSVVDQAKRQGVVKYLNCSIRYCSMCGTSAGYATYARNSSRHRKGDKNLDRPLTLAGIDCRDSAIRLKDFASLGGCCKCVGKLKPLLLRELADIPCEMPEHMTGVQQRWTKVRHFTCTKCEWTGPETLMKRARILFGNDTYPTGCPKCDATNGLFRAELKLIDTFEMRELK